MSYDDKGRRLKFRNLSQRITTALWGLAVIAFGIGVVAHLSGVTFDVELAGIISLTALGTWILVSALYSLASESTSRRPQPRKRPAPRAKKPKASR